MRVIEKNSIGEAHEAVVAEIVLNGDHIVTENGEETLESPEPIAIHVNSPFSQPMVSDACLFKEKFLKEYVSKVTDITPRKNDGTDAVYTYGNRLRDYPRKWCDNNGRPVWGGDGNKDGIDQLPITIDKLASNPNTRRAIMHTWAVQLDITNAEPPCVQTTQFLIRGSKINMIVYIRSNDMLSAWGANAYALAHLLDMVVKGVNAKGHNYSMGWIETISVSAHIYHKRDKMELDRFRAMVRI